MTMKKGLFLFFVVALVFTSCGITTKNNSPINATSEQANFNIYLPVMSHSYIPSFGVEISNVSTYFLEQAEDAKNYWVRINGLLWSEVQPTQNGNLQWDSELEESLIEANQKGMHVVLTVRSTPRWQQTIPGYTCSPMKDFTVFAAFMKKVVARYSVSPYNVMYYEIWNEPDAPINESNPDKPWGCWGDASLPDNYGGSRFAEMLKVVYPAMKAANPEVNVVLGGLLLDCDPRQEGTVGYCKSGEHPAYRPRFIEDILEAGGGDYFDYINFHGYTYYGQYKSAIQKEKDVDTWSANGGIIDGKLDYIHYVYNKYSVSKPIMITEPGFALPTEWKVIPDDFQSKKADYVVWLFTRNLARGVYATMWNSLNPPGWRDTGLLQDTKEAYQAYQVLTVALDRAVYVKDVTDQPEGIIGFEFRKDGHRLLVLFSEDGTKLTTKKLYWVTDIYDLQGETLSLNPDNTLTFDRPVYIEYKNDNDE